MNRFKRFPFPELVNPIDETAVESGRQPLVLLVAGLGGYNEMLHVISSLPMGLNFYFIVFQSLPEEFIHPFSVCVGKVARLPTLPVDSMRNLEPGHCYFASLESHIVFQKNETGGCLFADATSCSRLSRGKNMDDFIHTVVDNYEGGVHAVFLSGTEGIDQSSIETIRKNNGKIIIQEPSTCMMPTFLEELVEKKIADITVFPEKIAGEVLNLT